MDFMRVKKRTTSKKITISPDFLVKKSTDLMIRGGGFYAIWNDERGLWSLDEYDVQLLVDRELMAYVERLKTEIDGDREIVVNTMSSFDSSSWTRFKSYLSKVADCYRQLDTQVIFSNTEINKNTYASRRLPYPLEAGATPAFDELFGTLYDEDNLTKIMWAIGSIVAGESKRIQKFLVFFGRPGTGKSTTLKLIEDLFPGYYAIFEAKALTGGANQFSAEVFKSNPLIGINHEGDLSNIRDNSLLNSIVSHDEIVINAKYQQQFAMRLNAMLFVATNKPVYITDSQSGLIRRLIDVHPTGDLIPPDRYDELVHQLQFELGAIANRCYELFRGLGKTYYNRYKPLDMMLRTNHVFNFVDEHRFDFQREDWITLTRAWALYKDYCEAVGIEHRLNRNVFRDELRSYWGEFHGHTRIDGKQYRSVFVEFNEDLFVSGQGVQPIKEPETWLQLSEKPSILDELLFDRPAQLASEEGTPKQYWSNVTTTLADINTTFLHFYLPPENLVVIDFDLKDANGQKSLELNLEAASRFTPTYAEVSKSGKGLHLTYFYDGDVKLLDPLYADGIEVKISTGKASIRRKKTLCNDLPVATISSGLPIRERKDYVISEKTVKSEKALRELILRNLRKEIHGATTPSIDFINKILSDAYHSGLVYDVSDMLPRILEFASNSTNNPQHCISVALKLKLASEEESVEEVSNGDSVLTFFDVEVFPNVNMVRFKTEGPDKVIQGFVNPTPEDVGGLLRRNLVGFNNRRYDNHILYAIYLGYSPVEVFNVSKAITSGERNAYFREAYNISYTDVYCYSSNKQSLKKWEVELGLPHRELDWDWDTPLPEEMWDTAIQYCDNDVLATEAVHQHLVADYNARLILAELAGLSPNQSTQKLTSQIVFGGDKNPQKSFVYPDLSAEFPGYEFKIDQVGNPPKFQPVSTYRGEVVGEGGYVYAKPGIYRNVVYMDISSMHPTSLIVLNLFGKYTKKFEELVKSRVDIKEGRIEQASNRFGGKLRKYLQDKDLIKDLAYSLKIAINIVYGLTAARFDNDFKDPRNKDNVVAKRGALFMVDLKHALEDRGINLIHIKTDSVKIADYTEEDVGFVIEFGKKYNYDFGVECVFQKLALINDAVLIAKEDNNTWDAVGARFSHPYIFKTMFTREPLELSDYSETRAVRKGVMYLDMGPGEEDSDNLIHVGRVGRFYPVVEGGGRLVRINEGKRYAVTGTKGFRWQIDEMVEEGGGVEQIDKTYFEDMLAEAKEKISEFGDLNQIIDPT
jgi:hypothetical protein